MHRIGLVALAVSLVALGAMGCSATSVDCVLGAPPTSPVDVRAGSSGRAVVEATIGPDAGRTEVGDVRADLHAMTVDEVVTVEPHADPGDPGDPSSNGPALDASAVADLEEVGVMRYSGGGCGKPENASLEDGTRVLLLLTAPRSADAPWTVDGAVAVLDIAGEPGSETATWQHRTTAGEAGCDGHLTYDLATLEAAFRAADDAGSTAVALPSTCTPA